MDLRDRGGRVDPETIGDRGAIRRRCARYNAIGAARAAGDVIGVAELPAEAATITPASTALLLAIEVVS